MTEESRIIGERLGDLGPWEVFRFASEDSDEVVCTVALRPAPTGEADYGVFRGQDAEPSASGAIAREPGAWSDEAREAVLKEILSAYEPKLPGLRGGVVFELGGARQDEDTDTDKDEDEDEDEDGAGDEGEAT